jgi:hypothetical protein
MPRFVGSETSYYALRVSDRAHGSAWLERARRAPDAPPAIRAVLNGRWRVELTAEEAWAALAWARKVEGWDDDSRPPLWIYPIGPEE